MLPNLVPGPGFGAGPAFAAGAAFVAGFETAVDLVATDVVHRFGMRAEISKDELYVMFNDG